MWLKWLPWRWMVRNIARKKGFLDPFSILYRLEQFMQPSEVAAPVELLRSGVVLHSRGLMNSQAIQHNLDWVWPYWVECQFNPQDKAFIPRAFSITHINLTHRNWTAVGIPETSSWPIVDPRGLLTPFFDGWSIDLWVIKHNGDTLIPSRCQTTAQSLYAEEKLAVVTETQKDGMTLAAEAEVVHHQGFLKCHLRVKASADEAGWLVVSLRPYNPEGVSFIHDIALSKDRKSWKVNKEKVVQINSIPDKNVFSSYRQGDVFKRLDVKDECETVTCNVGMATAAALFELKSNEAKELVVETPLEEKHDHKPVISPLATVEEVWALAKKGASILKVPDDRFQFLYDTAVKNLILHSPGDVYPGPYTYKRFWFRDAAFILHAMLCIGLTDRVKRVIDRFPLRQTVLGYFLSQEGEWDSNGEALWLMEKFVQFSDQEPSSKWMKSIESGGMWIVRKRLSKHPDSAHAGLLPAGFSAEHLGPNDYYYWDDFFGVAGLRSAAILMGRYNKKSREEYFNEQADDFMGSINQSLQNVEARFGQRIIPAAPYRRMDAGAIGSIVAGYPLKLLDANDERLFNTAEYLFHNCFYERGFFQDMTHSGINPYLTLHIAQVFLRAQDPRYWDLMKTVADLATSTGQWPEAVHPHTRGGCMGDGQHMWAAAEWVQMTRNCFVREEQDKLILCSGIPWEWMNKKEDMTFGPTLTNFGTIEVFIECSKDKPLVRWKAKWYDKAPDIEVRISGYQSVITCDGQESLSLDREMIP